MEYAKDTKQDKRKCIFGYISSLYLKFISQVYISSLHLKFISQVYISSLYLKFISQLHIQFDLIFVLFFFLFHFFIYINFILMYYDYRFVFSSSDDIVHVRECI